MRLSEFVRTLMCLSVAGGMCLFTAGQISAQDLLPAVRWNVDSGNWSDGGNWVLAGSDPAVTGVPGADEQAARRSPRGSEAPAAGRPRQHHSDGDVQGAEAAL